MDYSLFQFLQQIDHVHPFIDALVVFWAKYAIIPLLACAVFIARKKIFTLLSLPLAFGINALIGLLWFRPRPFMSHQVIQLIHHDATKSFPSDHTAIAFAVAGSLFYISRPAGLIAVACAMAIGISRVLAGVHYPLDILGGACVGLLSAWLITMLYRKWRKN